MNSSDLIIRKTTNLNSKCTRNTNTVGVLEILLASDKTIATCRKECFVLQFMDKFLISYEVNKISVHQGFTKASHHTKFLHSSIFLADSICSSPEITKLLNGIKLNHPPVNSP